MATEIQNTELTNRIKNVLSKFPEIDAAFMFGSRAEGRARLDSDIDIALVVNHPIGSKKLDILAALTAEGIDNIDLVTLDKDDLVLRFEAVRHNKLIYAKNSFDRGSYYSRVLREYFDFLPYLERQRSAKKRRLAGG